MQRLSLDFSSVYFITPHHFPFSAPATFKKELLDVTILQIGKLRVREGKYLVQEHPPSEWWSQH